MTWSAPEGLPALVTVAELQDAPSDRAFFFATKTALARLVVEGGDGSAKHSYALQLPAISGTYEIRYVLDRPTVILARRTIEIEPYDYALTAPDSASISSPIEIGWQGRGDDKDIITIVTPGAEEEIDNARYTGLAGNNPVSLNTPSEPGAYEIRYVTGVQRQVKATRPLEVTGVSATLDAPDSATGGSAIDIAWTGPDGWENDLISIAAPGEGFNRKRYKGVRSGRGEELNPLSLHVPESAGDYEILYVVEPGRKVIARRPISVTAISATVMAPASVKAGEALRCRVDRSRQPKRPGCHRPCRSA